MTEPKDKHEEYELDELEFLMSQAERVNSKEEFLRILVGISDICSKDEESWERRMVHFVDVVDDFLKHDLVVTPKDQDWKWLARLFLIGAFKN